MNKENIANEIHRILTTKKIDEIVKMLNATLLLHRQLYGRKGYPIFDLNDSDGYLSTVKFTPLSFHDILDENSDDNSRLIQIQSYEYKDALVKNKKFESEHRIDDAMIRIIFVKFLYDIALKAEEQMAAESKVVCS